MAKTKRKAKQEKEAKVYITTIHDANTGKLHELQAHTNEGTGRRYKLKQIADCEVGLFYTNTYEATEVFE